MRGIDPLDKAVVFACGTDWQALDRMIELAARGFREIAVSDPAGKDWTRAEFERFVDE